MHKYLNDHETGGHLYNIQRHVGAWRKVGWKQRAENAITHLRKGQTGLNHTWPKIGEHPTVEHVPFHCRRYNIQRKNTITLRCHVSWGKQRAR